MTATFNYSFVSGFYGNLCRPRLFHPRVKQSLHSCSRSKYCDKLKLEKQLHQTKKKATLYFDQDLKTFLV